MAPKSNCSTSEALCGNLRCFAAYHGSRFYVGATQNVVQPDFGGDMRCDSFFGKAANTPDSWSAGFQPALTRTSHHPRLSAEQGIMLPARLA
jgi:hypothetical protein